MVVKDVFFIQSGFCYHPEKMVMRGASLKPRLFPSTVAVIEHQTKGICLFDTGYSPRFFEATKSYPNRLYALLTPVHLQEQSPLIDQLKLRGIGEADVSYVVLSHFHADHVAGLKDFPTPQIIASKYGWETLRYKLGYSALRAGFLKSLLPENFDSRYRSVEGYSEIDLPFKEFPCGFDLMGDSSIVAVELPGHAPGHYGLLVTFGQKKIFLIADAVWTSESLTSQKPPSRLAHLLMDNVSDYYDTFSKLVSFVKNYPEIEVIPCHCTTALARQQLAPTLPQYNSNLTL